MTAQNQTSRIKPDEKDKRFHRAVFTVKLTCCSNTHVGDGHTKAYEEARALLDVDNNRMSKSGADILGNVDISDNKVLEYATCSSGGTSLDKSNPCDEKIASMYIPGSTLKNAFRRSLIRLFLNSNINSQDTTIDSLVGKINAPSGEQQGGIVRISDAKKSKNADSGSTHAHWLADRGTALYARNRINEDTLVAEEGALFYQEYYPKGTEFEFTITLVRPTQEQLDYSGRALANWQGELEDQIGANQSKSWGMVSFKATRLTTTTLNTDDETRLYTEINTDQDLSAFTADKTKHTAHNFIPLEFVTQQPLLIADPARVYKDKPNNTTEESELFDKISYFDGENYVITATAFWGAFKALAKRIARSYGLDSCKLDSCKLEEHIHLLGDSLHKALQIKPWIAHKPLNLNDQSAKKEPITDAELHTQTFIAIDNLTQGVKLGALLNVKAIPPASLLSGGGILLPKPWCELDHGLQKILSLTFTDIIENGLWLGGDKAKGYGLVTLSNTISLKDNNDKEIQLQFNSRNDGENISNDAKETLFEKSPSYPTKTPVEKPQSNEFLNRSALNPYALLSLKQIWKQGPTVAQAIQQGATHSNFNAQRYTGKLSIELETKSHVFVGNARTGEPSTGMHISHYQRNGKTAIPANSLRGMVQNTARILSQSRLKNYNNSLLTQRKQQNLSAAGILLKEGDQWFVQPLTLPIQFQQSNQGVTETTLSKKWGALFGDDDIELKSSIIYYLNDKGEAAPQLGAHARKGITNSDVDISALASNKNRQYALIHDDLNNTNFSKCIKNQKLHVKSPLFRIKPLRNKKYLMLTVAKLDQATLKEPNGEKNKHSINGILRFPELKQTTHHHGMFIPTANIKKIKPIKIPNAVQEKFELLHADSATEHDISPNIPIGSVYGKNKEYTLSEAQVGDIVFYDINDDASQITEFSYSSMWRGFARKDALSVQDAISAMSANNNHDFLSLLPYGESSEDQLTPTELMFGVIPAPNSQDDSNKFKAIASRVRFTDAVNNSKTGLEQESASWLPQQGSPKAAPKHITPYGLGQSVRIPLRLRPTADYQSNDQNVTANKSQVAAIKPGNTANFDVHFHNLSQGEMSLLLQSMFPDAITLPNTAAEKPNKLMTPTFMHKLGIAKNRQLGSIQLKPQALQINTYQAGLEKQLFDQVSTCALIHEKFSELNLIDQSSADTFLSFAKEQKITLNKVNYAIDKNLAKSPSYNGDKLARANIGRDPRNNQIEPNSLPIYRT